MPSSVRTAAEELQLDRKRKRLATVCLTCRTRKLKCDKEYPACGRCKKSGKPEQCMYDEAAVRELHHGADEETPGRTVSDGHIYIHPDLGSRIANLSTRTNSQSIGFSALASQSLEDRIISLERLMLQRAQTPSLQSPYSAQHSITARLPEPALIVSSLVAQFPDFKVLTKELKHGNLILRRLFKEVGSLERLKPAAMLNSQTVVDRPFLQSLMPAREVVDTLIDIYLEFIEPVYRLSYLPDFEDQLHRYNQNAEDASDDLIVQLLLMMATVWHLKYNDRPLSKWQKKVTGQEPLAYILDGFNHLKAGYWIICCEDYIRRHKMKRVDTDTLRLTAHVILAKDANRIRYKHEWTSTGTLVKMAMSCSFHRDPDPNVGPMPFGKKRYATSIHARELRRRIWATTVELDLKASFDKGVPPTVHERDFDSLGPANVDDEEFGPSAQAQPLSHSSDHPTDSSLQHQLFQTLPLRLRTCALVYSPRFVTSYGELAQLDNELTQALEDIPEWDESASSKAIANFKQRARLWRGVLKYKLRHAMLCLHNRLALLGGVHTMLPTSQHTRVEIAGDILLHHMTTSECFRRLNVLAPLDCYGQAALTVCHYLFTTKYGGASQAGRLLVPELTDSLLVMAEKLLGDFEAKAVLTGKGHKEHLLISTIIALTRIKMSPQSEAAIRQQLVDRLASLGYHMLGRMGPDAPTNEANQPQPAPRANDTRPTPSSNLAATPDALVTDFGEYKSSYVPTIDTTPSDWGWDFLPAEWASTNFFSV